MPPQTFVDELLIAAQYLGCPMDDSARRLLEGTFELYAPRWAEGPKAREQVRSSMRVAVVRAVMSARANDRIRISADGLRTALLRSPLPPHEGLV